MATATQPRASAPTTKFSFAITRNALLEALQRAATASPQRTTLPILNSVLIRAKAGELMLTCTDLDRTVATRVTAALSGEGESALPAKRLIEIVSALPTSATLEVTVNNNRAKLVAGRSKFDVLGSPVDEWPHGSAGEMKDGAQATADGRAFVATLRRVALHVAPQNHAVSRPALVCANLHIDEAGAHWVGTDGGRISRVAVKLRHGAKPLIGEFLLPRSAFAPVEKLFADDETVTITGTPRQQLRIEGTHTTFSARLVEEKFPQYTQIFLVPPVAHAIIGRAELEAAIKRVVSVADMDRVEFAFGDSELTLRVVSQDSGAAEDVIPCAFAPGGPITSPHRVALNPWHVLNALDSMGGDETRLDFTGGHNPIYIRDAKTPDSTTVAASLPLRAPG